jgi:hypothetical protein
VAEFDTSGLGPIIDEYDSNGMENKPDPNSNVESEGWAAAHEENWIQCPHSCKKWFRMRMISYHINNCCPDVE